MQVQDHLALFLWGHLFSDETRCWILGCLTMIRGKLTPSIHIDRDFTAEPSCWFYQIKSANRDTCFHVKTRTVSRVNGNIAWCVRKETQPGLTDVPRTNRKTGGLPLFGWVLVESIWVIRRLNLFLLFVALWCKFCFASSFAGRK